MSFNACIYSTKKIRYIQRFVQKLAIILKWISVYGFLFSFKLPCSTHNPFILELKIYSFLRASCIYFCKGEALFCLFFSLKIVGVGKRGKGGMKTKTKNIFFFFCTDFTNSKCILIANFQSSDGVVQLIFGRSLTFGNLHFQVKIPHFFNH